MSNNLETVKVMAAAIYAGRQEDLKQAGLQYHPTRAQIQEECALSALELAATVDLVAPIWAEAKKQKGEVA